MRLILPITSAISAIRSQFSRSMSASNFHESSDTNIRHFLKDIYQKSPRNVFSVYVTGGGSKALEWLFTVPGASNCLMDAGVVYSRSALEDFIKGDDSIYSCSQQTALRMADRAWTTAGQHLLSETRNFNDLRDVHIHGLSCTASLVSDSPKKGSHRVHVGSTSQRSATVYTIEFEKMLRDRAGEDEACSRLLLEAIGHSCDVTPPPTDFLFPREDTDTGLAGLEIIQKNVVEKSDVIERIYKKEVRQALFVKRQDESGKVLDDEFLVLEDVAVPNNSLIVSGSFNPLHEGHVAMVIAALKKMTTDNNSEINNYNNTNENLNGYESENSMTTKISKKNSKKISKNFHDIPVIFEISAINADKPPIPHDELIQRIKQFNPYTNEVLKSFNLTNIAVSITSEPLFLQKSDLFRNCKFLIGTDTLSRIINPKYYGKNLEINIEDSDIEKEKKIKKNESEKICNMVAALSVIAERGAGFIIGGRRSSGEFDTMNDIIQNSHVDIPDSLIESIFCGLSEDEFRVDLSSTEIRNRNK
mmetsp:Transcript_21954/g.21235  ORF Transcript_21954/g.21235 Transcript_21954/m.21235 type:complete len:531 (+) Transcript_21954:142-1734(+)